MDAELVQYAMLGDCRIELVKIQDGNNERWILVYRSPQEPRIDLLSQVVRKAGGALSGTGDTMGIVYTAASDAHDAFGLMLETVLIGVGGVKVPGANPN
jgi:hypothetical protein